MTRDAPTQRVGELAGAVVADPRFERDDLSVSVLGMLLYGYALGQREPCLTAGPPELVMIRQDARDLGLHADRMGRCAERKGSLGSEGKVRQPYVEPWHRRNGART